MRRLDSILCWACFALVCLAVLPAPWFFGAWEMWWFWPFVAVLSSAVLVFALRFIVSPGMLTSKNLGDTRLAAFLLLSVLPFMLYAFFRFLQAEVYIDAERITLLFLTPLLLMAMVIVSFTDMQVKAIFLLVFSDFFALGLYGVINHSSNGSSKILWTRQIYEQYFGRATGTYFCPDHFAGLMEIMIALALGIMIGRGRTSLMRYSGSDSEIVSPTRKRRRRRDKFSLSRLMFAITIIMVGLIGVLVSKSRGGGISICILFFSALMIGFRRMKRSRRWMTRGACIGLLILAVAVLFSTRMPYVTRFKQYFAWDSAKGKSFTEKQEVILERLQYTSRYNMFSAALRAWQTEPVFGIGPGMHQNLWPQFAASPDGDRATGKWPARPNYDFHSYEVHSDWLQLLEEYGAVGLLLFTFAFVTIAGVLFYGIYYRVAAPSVVGGLLATVVMAFHSLGDFNLQIPATTWLLACIIAVALANVLRAGVPQEK